MTGMTRVTAEEIERLAFAHRAEIEVDPKESLMVCTVGKTVFYAAIAPAVDGAA